MKVRITLELTLNADEHGRFTDPDHAARNVQHILCHTQGESWMDRVSVVCTEIVPGTINKWLVVWGGERECGVVPGSGWHDTWEGANAAAMDWLKQQGNQSVGAWPRRATDVEMAAYHQEQADEPTTRCRFCRGDEKASSCDCV